MGWTQTILLAVVQGLTEFIPVSSSAHLVIIPGIFSWQTAPLFYDVMVHFGTALSILLYFVIDFLKNRDKLIGESGFTRLDKKSIAMWIVYIALGTFPAAVIGFLFNDFFESFFNAPVYAAFFLMITGFILLSADLVVKLSKRNRNIGWLS